MTDQTEPMDHDQAAEIVENEPALGGWSDPDENNPGTDDDATTPDQAVTEQD